MTYNVTMVLCCRLPPLPVTVMGYVPTGVLPPTLMIIAELPEPGAGIGFGLKLTLVPLGNPVADKEIALLKLPLATVVIVEVL